MLKYVIGAGGGGAGVLGSFFYWACVKDLSDPYPIIHYSVANYKPLLLVIP